MTACAMQWGTTLQVAFLLVLFVSVIAAGAVFADWLAKR